MQHIVMEQILLGKIMNPLTAGEKCTRNRTLIEVWRAGTVW